MPAAEVICGDVAEVAREMRADSFDGCLCDPPYGLEFMGKDWDSPWKQGFSEYGYSDDKFRSPGPTHGSTRNPVCQLCHKHKRGTHRCRCAKPEFDETCASDNQRLQSWFESWAREIFRVLKPGAHLLAFGGTRTHHRLMCAIEDAGFEIRDCMMWLYGSGFPKSLDISKALDRAAGIRREVIGVRGDGTSNSSGREGAYNFRGRDIRHGSNNLTREIRITAPATPEAVRWSGYGTALKPAFEPVLLCMKPCAGTFAENALKWGVAGLAVDACRIGTGNKKWESPRGGIWSTDSDAKCKLVDNPLGRWPANLILDEETARMLDEQSGELQSGALSPRNNVKATTGWSGGSQPDRVKHTFKPNSGGASRFFYVAKASRSERGVGNRHPTVKPLKLCAYLARLILPPVRESDPRRILVPFSGSGSEMIGALSAGWDLAIGIENEPAYVRIAESRLRDRVPGIASISLETLETILECA